MRVNKWDIFVQSILYLYCRLFVLLYLEMFVFWVLSFLSLHLATSGELTIWDKLCVDINFATFCELKLFATGRFSELTFCDNLWVDILQSLFSELKFCHILWVDILWVDILCELTFSYLFSELTIHGCSIKEENHNLAEGPYTKDN